LKINLQCTKRFTSVWISRDSRTLSKFETIAYKKTQKRKLNRERIKNFDQHVWMQINKDSLVVEHNIAHIII